MAFQSISSLSKRDQLLFNGFGRGPSVPIPHRTVHEAFEAVADLHPAAVAVRHHTGETITYGELDRRANVLANRLLRAQAQSKPSDGHGQDQPQQRRLGRVILVVSRGIEMTVGIMAILKAGGQYVPLDGGVVAAEALAHIVADTGAAFVLCLRKHRAKIDSVLPPGGNSATTVVELDAPEGGGWGGEAAEAGAAAAVMMGGPVGQLRHSDEARPNVQVDPRDGAYIIYTSGTTGKPKGVDVLHLGVTNVLLLEPARLGMGVGKNVAQLLSVSFDMGAWETLGSLMNGATLHTRSSDWADCLRRVDTVVATPSVLGRFRQADFPNIRTVAVGGEPCPLPLAEEWAPHVRFQNTCGPTEITIVNTGHLHIAGGPLTIGTPNPNTTLYVLDDDEQPVPVGQPGIMWAGGACVSRGYINLPELTASRYKLDKFAADGTYMFNTGDLGRWLDDGSLEHLGRKDDQVKVKGFRVELDGVSAAIEQFPTVTKACALLIEGELWGFYAAPAQVDEEAMQRAVSVLLPYYAVPSHWRHSQRIELTSNGKIDKRILKAIAADTDKGETGKKLVKVEPAHLLSNKTSEITLAPSVPVSAAARKSADTEKGLSAEDLSIVELKEEDEKQMETYELPDKMGFHGQRWLRHRFFSLYRRLFSVIFLSNLAAFIFLTYHAVVEKRSLPVPKLAVAVAANLMCSVLMRQDHVVNFLFWAATSVSTNSPLWLRRQLARIFHIGGVHSGCAISATMWWIIFTGQATVNFSNGDKEYPVNGGMIILTWLILLLLVVIVAMAFPRVRAYMHDQFEWTHRFAGWTTLALVWAHLVVSTDSMTDEPLGMALVQSPTLWLLLVTTFSIALPWMGLRRVTVRPEPLSKHAVRLHFDFCTPISGKGVRISDRPLAEWHAFAVINKPGVKGFSIVVSRAGDWTGRTIDRPPKQIWTRGVPASGVLRVAPLFKKMVLVATGSGIGPCLPVIMEKRVPVRILWSTPHPLETFGQEILDAVLDADPNAVIWNTRTQGKPDLAALAYQMMRESDCEAVGVISNQTVTEKLVYQLESRGVVAFGPVFDS